jgi:beta-mannosidase
MTRKDQKTYASDLGTAFFEIATILEIWGTNSTLEEKKVTLEVTAFELDSEWTEKWSKEVVLAPNAATELFKGDLPRQPKRTKASEIPRTIIISARLLDSDGAVLARYANWCASD